MIRYIFYYITDDRRNCQLNHGGISRLRVLNSDDLSGYGTGILPVLRPVLRPK